MHKSHLCIAVFGPGIPAGASLRQRWPDAWAAPADWAPAGWALCLIALRSRLRGMPCSLPTCLLGPLLVECVGVVVRVCAGRVALVLNDLFQQVCRSSTVRLSRKEKRS